MNEEKDTFKKAATTICVGVLLVIAFGIFVECQISHVDNRTTVDYGEGVVSDKPAIEYAEEVNGITTYSVTEARSGHWPTVMHHFLRNEKWEGVTVTSPDVKDLHIAKGKWVDFNDGVDRSCCRCCGSKENLNVHHIKPFHIDPSLECDPYNLCTLCRDHHFHIGHHDNWKNSNPNVCKDCDLMRSKLNPNK